MNRRLQNQNLAREFQKKKTRTAGDYLTLFCLSASNYYVLSCALSVAIFLGVWGILYGGYEETPWVTAGITACLFLVLAVLIREKLLRKLRYRLLLNQKNLDYNLHTPRNQVPKGQTGNKLTLEKNSEIIAELEKKSKAARILERLPEGHLEVFELCEEYLQKNQRELENIGAGSPRLAFLRRSREKVEKLHKYHLLTWASLESRLHIQEAKIRVTIGGKLENAQRALIILDSATQFYPADTSLIQSIAVVKEFIVSVRVSHWMEQAERAAFKKNYKRAINHYRDALFFLARENERTPQKDLIAEKINLEIEKLLES